MCWQRGEQSHHSIKKEVPHSRYDNQEQDKANDRCAAVMLPRAKRPTVEEIHWMALGQ